MDGPALGLACSCRKIKKKKVSQCPMPSTTKNNHKYYYNHSLRQPTITRPECKCHNANAAMQCSVSGTLLTSKPNYRSQRRFWFPTPRIPPSQLPLFACGNAANSKHIRKPIIPPELIWSWAWLCLVETPNARLVPWLLLAPLPQQVTGARTHQKAELGRSWKAPGRD